MKLPIDRAKNFLVHADRDISAFYILVIRMRQWARNYIKEDFEPSKS